MQRAFRFIIAATVLPFVTARAQLPDAIVDSVVSAMCQRQVVLLGELPSHGEALAFDAKARITDSLIARCGFSAVLFEAPIYDFIGLEQDPTPERLDNAIGRFWLTRELAPWRRRLFEAASRRQLVVGGIDDQLSITSHHARGVLPQLVAAASPDSSAAGCREAVTRHVGWTYNAANPFDEREQLKLQRCARSASIAVSGSSDITNRLMLENFARYAERVRPGSTATRDESMFRNLAWYIDRIPAGSRVVVWTSTVHAARQRGSLPWLPLGAQAVARWGERVGSVGFTAYTGFTSMAARPATPIPAAEPGSLEATTTSDSPAALLTTDRLRAIGPAASRLFGRFVTQSWSDFFDLVVVIRHEVAPTFDPWK